MSVVDWEAFFSLISNDKALFRELLDLYKSDWPPLMTHIEESIKNRNSKDLEGSSHRIKGMVRNFFAEETAELAGRIEIQARESNFNGLEPILRSLKQKLIELEKELQAKLGEMP